MRSASPSASIRRSNTYWGRDAHQVKVGRDIQHNGNVDVNLGDGRLAEIFTPVSFRMKSLKMTKDVLPGFG